MRAKAVTTPRVSEREDTSMNKSQILHDIAMTLQAKKDFVAGCSAGCTATSGAIRITDKDGNNFIVTVTVAQPEATA